MHNTPHSQSSQTTPNPFSTTPLKPAFNTTPQKLRSLFESGVGDPGVGQVEVAQVGAQLEDLVHQAAAEAAAVRQVALLHAAAHAWQNMLHQPTDDTNFTHGLQHWETTQLQSLLCDKDMRTLSG